MTKQRSQCVDKMLPTSWAAVYFMPGRYNFFLPLTTATTPDNTVTVSQSHAVS